MSVETIFFFNRLISACRHLLVFFLRCWSHVILLKNTVSTLWPTRIWAAVALPLLGKLRGICSDRKVWSWNSIRIVLKTRSANLGIPLLILFALLLGTASTTQADQFNCSDPPYNGVIDGNLYPFPDNIKIDTNCTIKNYPGGMSTNFSFDNNDPTPYLVIFDNVLHTGQMACNAVAGHTIWYVNSSSISIQEGCQNLLIPVEKIDKEIPAPTAAIGVPFTYTLTIPVLYNAATGTVINSSGSLNDLHSIKITDDLNATGVSLTYVSHDAYWQDSLDSVPHTFSNVGGVLNFNIDTNTIIPAGDQIVLKITVVLDNTSTNFPGKVFTNTAKWSFGRLIDGVYYEPLPGEWGISDPMTIVEPDLVVTKTSSTSTIRAGNQASYTINIQNTGRGDAWNTTITDNIPAGMCNFDSSATVTAQIFAADGVTLVRDLKNTDFSVAWNGGSASACQLSLQMLTAEARIGPTQRLIINYQAMLDAGISSGTFTNVAGATQWFSASSSSAGRREYDGPLTNGTPGVLDNQDAYTITATDQGYYFLKSVDDLTTGAYPATAAFPGDRLRYTLQIQNYNIPPLNNITVTDDLGALNGFTAFVPGSLSLASTDLPVGTYTICPNCGINGTGTITINGLNLASNQQYQIQFDVTLASNLTEGTQVLNQSSLSGTDIYNTPWSGVSDDPHINGPSMLSDTGNITPITIQSRSPALRVLKMVQDITSGTSTVMAGDILRYTIAVKNIGTEDATDVTLRDLVPANTSYMANSTRLNGTTVTDPSTGVSALQNGMLINSPANPTAGVMPADANEAAANTATITFDVQISTTVVDGTIISNQGFVNGSGVSSGMLPEQPSDNPATPNVPNDPTTVVVGNMPLVYALKIVGVVDNNSNGFVDSKDVLHYTITLTNSGTTPATGVVLTDAVPQYTTYIQNSVTLNGISVPDLASGSPLASGMAVSSSNLTPPLPAAGSGTLSPGENAVVTFDVLVNDNIPSLSVPAGTLISNQGSVGMAQLPTLLTDADGNSSNGYQPTVVAVGDAQQLSIIKSIAVVGGGAALPDSQLEYTIQVTNVGMVPATNVLITDDLTPLAAQVTYVAGSATMNGSPNGVSFTSPVLTATYGAALDPGSSVIVRFDVKINSNVVAGTTLTNTARVSWDSPDSPKDAAASVNVGTIPGSAALNGTVWHDADLDKINDGTEQHLQGWSVQLYRNNQLLATVLTDANGIYQLTGLAPNIGTTDLYELRFRAANAGPNTPSLGNADSPFTNGPQRISDIIVNSGDNLQNLNLPLWPNGAVYNSVVRQPIAGVRLALVNATTGTALPSQCFDDPVQQNQITASDGFYKFDLNFSDASCPAGGDYLIEVTPPPTGYMNMPSQIIPPTSDTSMAPFSVPTCPGSADDAVPATEYCEAVASEQVPPPSVQPQTPGTVYYMHLLLSNGVMPEQQSQIFNNFIPIDPVLDGAVAITKTTPLINVTRGTLVPYTITVTNVYGMPLSGISIVDRFPAGFKYVAGSARMDGNPAEPQINGLELVWDDLELQVNQKYTIKLLLVVGSGVSEEEYVNRALVLSTATGSAVSREATATVRVIPDPTFDCTDFIGKVFDDSNLNGQQDRGEKGLPGVRLVTVRGLIATSDKNGRFHITCAAIPDEDQGSNSILKLDERTLPSGYRLTTENPRVQRATRGKMLRFNFGATIHRVVRIDIADGVFKPNKTELRLQWTSKITQLLEELRKAPSVLRLSYLGDVERKGLVKERLEALKEKITKQWKQSGSGYRLAIETEIFWRRGSPLAGQ
jgi:large repetitive protein